MNFPTLSPEYARSKLAGKLPARGNKAAPIPPKAPSPVAPKPSIAKTGAKARAKITVPVLSVSQLPDLKEAEIQRQIINRLLVDRWLVVRVNSGGFKDKRGQLVKHYIIQGLKAWAGFPDVLALKGDVKGGRFLLIEVKTRTGVLTKSQRAFARFAKRYGITVHVARSVDDVKRIYTLEDGQ